jgi:DNA-binding transcriptional regulator YiaG
MTSLRVHDLQTLVSLCVPGSPDIPSLRKNTGLSQAAFADSLGVQVGTIRN